MLEASRDKGLVGLSGLRRDRIKIVISCLISVYVIHSNAPSLIDQRDCFSSSSCLRPALLLYASSFSKEKKG